MIVIQCAEARELGTENWDWETFLEVDSYKEAAEQLAKLINDNDAVGDFFRVIETNTPKPLAQYLMEYIEHETGMDCHYGTWRELLEQALAAYESTENVLIHIIKKKAEVT